MTKYIHAYIQLKNKYLKIKKHLNIISYFSNKIKINIVTYPRLD